MLHESIFTEITVTGITVYGLALLFIKALLIVLLAQVFAESMEFSPASIRHTVWLIAFVSLALLPVLTSLLPAWHLIDIDVGQPIETTAIATQHPVAVTVLPSTLSTIDWLIIVYLLVVLCRLSYLTLEVVKVGWVTAKAHNASHGWYQQAERYFNGRLKIKISTALDGPVTWGTLYPVILLPESCEQWSQHEKDMVLRHELGHIQRADWLSQLLGQLIAVLYWPVPGISRALRTLSLEAEQSCDDQVLADGVTPADYAALLLRQAKVNKLQATVALGKPSELAQRIRHIVNTCVDRAGERKTRLWLAITASIFVLPFASVQAVGSFAHKGPLDGLVLTPVVMTPQKQPAIAQAHIPNIDKPARPEFLTAPLPELPHASIDQHMVTMPHAAINASATSREPVASAASIDVDLPGFASHKVQVRIKQQPEYPYLAQRRGIEGRVTVEFDIDSNGKVINPRITHSGNTSVFNRSVLKAIKGYQYEPYRMGGQAVGLQGLKEEFRFQLTYDKPSRAATDTGSTGDSRDGQSPPANSS